MTKKKADPEWMPASTALKKLRAYCGGHLATKRLLADLLKDGELDCRVGEAWDSKRPSIDDAWAKKDKLDLETDVELGRGVWRASRLWSEDLEQWRWDESRFVLTLSKTPTKRTFLVDVKFRSSQIAGLAPSNRAGAGGRKIRADDWAEIGVALIEAAQEGYFEPDAATTADQKPRYADVSEFVADILARTDDVYSPSHAHEMLAPVYRYFFPETQALSSRNNYPEAY